jgi:hypothetical protein
MAEPSQCDPRFEQFVFLQSQSAGLFLGKIPHPASGEPSVNLRAARSVVDSLEMLEEKTAGNLNEAEQKLLAVALDNIRPLLAKAEQSDSQ